MRCPKGGKTDYWVNKMKNKIWDKEEQDFTPYFANRINAYGYPLMYISVWIKEGLKYLEWRKKPIEQYTPEIAILIFTGFLVYRSIQGWVNIHRERRDSLENAINNE